jgi:hypothetical protein
MLHRELDNDEAEEQEGVAEDKIHHTFGCGNVIRDHSCQGKTDTHPVVNGPYEFIDNNLCALARYGNAPHLNLLSGSAALFKCRLDIIFTESGTSMQLSLETRWKAGRVASEKDPFPPNPAPLVSTDRFALPFQSPDSPGERSEHEKQIEPPPTIPL